MNGTPFAYKNAVEQHLFFHEVSDEWYEQRSKPT
jgi:hypothetical protein